MAQHSHHAEQEKGAGDEQEFGLLEGYETGNQDPRGNGSQGTKQRIFQGRLIVAGSAPDSPNVPGLPLLLRPMGEEKSEKENPAKGFLPPGHVALV